MDTGPQEVMPSKEYKQSGSEQMQATFWDPLCPSNGTWEQRQRVTEVNSKDQ